MKESSTKDLMICGKCKKLIAEDMAFVTVRGDIVLRTPKQKPMIFTCIEQAVNFASHILVHDVCWIKMLRDHGVKLYDMDKVAKEYAKKEKGK